MRAKARGGVAGGRGPHTPRGAFCVAAAAALAFAAGGQPAQAATRAQTYAAREAGLNWLVTHQRADGSWAGQGGTSPGGDGLFNDIDTTAVALMSFTSESRLNSLRGPVTQGPLGITGLKSDFVLTAAQQAAVTKGVAYLESQAQLTPIFPGPSGSPDVNGNGIGVSWANGSTQSTSLSFLALDQALKAQFTSGYSAVSSGPASLIQTGLLAGRSFGSVGQDVADFLAFSQTDVGSSYRGGWDYTPNTGAANATQSTFAVMTLETLEGLYGATIHPALRGELAYYGNSATNQSLGPDHGGVGEFSSGSPSFQATLLGTQIPVLLGGLADSLEFPGALTYLNAHWNDVASGTNALGAGNLGNPVSVWLFDKIFAGASDAIYAPGPPGAPYAFTDGRKGSLLFGTFTPQPFVVSDEVNNIGGACGGPAATLVSGACNWSESYQQWLVTHQNADGSFSTGAGYPNDTATTALYLQAIDGYEFAPAGLPGGVPEPGVWALLLLGFAGAGSALRRRRPGGRRIGCDVAAAPPRITGRRR